MKKSFLKLFTVALAGVAMAVSISGCETETARDEYGNEYYDDYFVELRCDPYYRIVYDKNTKVKYCIIKKATMKAVSPRSTMRMVACRYTKEMSR